MARVVVLSKPHPLTRYLEGRLAAAGYLAGTIYEARLDGWRGPVRYIEKLAKREGLARAIDVTAYEIYDRLARGAELAAATREIVPIDDATGRAVDQLPHTTVETLNGPAAREAIAALTPDFLVVHGTGILKPETFTLPRVASLNVHCGILPHYRGHASTFWALARRDYDNVGVTIHHIAAGVDTGGCVRQGRVPYAPGETDVTMWFRALRLGADLVVDAIHEWTVTGRVPSASLVGEHGPHYRRKGMTDYLRYRWHFAARN
jgi:folate-dependent phosphoribosylglycinamide formyltransferase PurN